MIVIKVEMWPGGNESRAQEFARATITNQISTTQQTGGHLGDYVIHLSGGIWGRPECQKRIWRSGRVFDFNRRSRGIWDLLYLGLRGLVGDRN